MSSQFLSLEEAAKKLGISTERLVDLRSQGQIRGFRDGASWKFPETELDRLAEDLASGSGAYDPYKGLDNDLEELDSDEFVPGTGSGVLVDDLELGSRSSRIIGGDDKSGSGAGSDVGVGSEPLLRSGSDVNLVAGDSNGSDVKVVSGSSSASDSDDFLLDGGRSDLVEIDSGELRLSADEPVLTHDSAVLDLAIEPNAGSTGPITDQELKEVASKNPDLMRAKKPGPGDSALAFDDSDDDDSGDDLIGLQSDDDVLGSDLDIQPRSAAGASSLELMDDLDLIGGSSGSAAGRSSRGVDVLSELDLLSADVGGSGLITGDSGSVLGSGSGKGSGSGSKGSRLDFDDALGDDDDLVIADDEDDLVLGGSASDVSVSGDSGINLMSPSDSGLSLESEPLDLAGSSISALDLGGEIGSGTGSGISGSAKSGRGSAIDFTGDEDFRLSPSGLGIDADGDSNSQVIEIEDSSAFADADAFSDADAFAQGDAFAEVAPDEGGFGDEAVVADGYDESGDEGMAAPSGAAGRGYAPVYEVPFSIFQVGMLLLTLMIMSVGGMLMTDLLRNMWAYTEIAPPVSSLTDSLIDLAQLNGQ
jgi:excisionase family DNA binding protein